ncbi:conserved hypothetical protein (DUF1684) [Formosa agariphila KMM 3901]|uniref:DUF1684 domain-containing protein n=1 Tax=Formosa agariphila (strain DSM 15362 / KCTC 12365 / LMG 23005 / KMM 3901 / M-2Alg 35-1) TaxID=1347342 RepID=T2KK93_FORAG|nr:DUF1684 domain-containing protein [Formosa agariphila]CDF78434.1 conserved hypothetical protein (DUF1684) [Formosa agariphila KMM 3901]
MKFLLYICLFISLSSCFQNKEPLLGDTPFQKSLNSSFKDASTSPLKKKDRKTFKGLDFFKVDSAYIVKAKLKHTPNTTFFAMPTTTNRMAQERVFGIVSFNIKGEDFELKIYESQDLLDKEGYEDYLFLPFLDLTNGDSTYGGGRYIELRVNDKVRDSIITIDFNTAFNPYCAYNEKYSCPIVPRDNFIDTEIKAGVKAFIKE